MGHKHPVLDADPHFKIDKETRTIKDQSQTPSILMQGDHNSERYTFEMPRYIDGHDMSLCDLVEIHYINTGSSNRAENRGIYIVDDLQVSEDKPEEIIQFTWLISSAVTMNAGSLSFLIRFACTEDGKILYAWNTGINKEKTIGMSIYNSEMTQEEHSDLIAHIEEAIKGKVDSKGHTTNKFLGVDENGNVIDKDVDYSEVKNTPKTLPNPNALIISGYTSGSYDGSAPMNVEIPAPPDIPEKLPNPNTLTFTGAVTGEYDGSSPLNIEVPTPKEPFTKLSQLQNDVDFVNGTEVGNKVNEHNVDNNSHNDMRLLIKGLTDRLNTIADADDVSLDQLSEIVAYIKDNKTLIEQVTTNKLSVSDVINNLTTNVESKALSAAMGVELKRLIDSLQSQDVSKEISEHDKSVTAHDDIRRDITQLNASLTELEYNKADAIVSTASGEQIVLTDSDMGAFKGLNVYGKSTQMQTNGVNLLNPGEIGTVIMSNDEKGSLVVQENGLHVTSNSTSDIYFYGKNLPVQEQGYEEVPELIPGNYYIRNKSSSLMFYVIAWRDSRSVILANTNNSLSNMFTIKQGDKFRIFLRPLTSGTIDVLEQPMIVMEKYNDAPYEPYTEGNRTPSIEYQQDIVNTGDKGDINIDVDNAGYIQKGTYFNNIRQLPLVKGRTYHIMCDKIMSNDINCFVFNESDKSFVTSANLYDYGYGSKRLTVVNDTGVVDKECRMPMRYSKEYTFKVTVDGLYLYQGVNIRTKDTDEFYIGYYTDINDEEYEKQTLTILTPNGFPAVPVPSGGNYTDSKGQRWATDEINYGRGKYIQRVKKFFVDGNCKKEKESSNGLYRAVYVDDSLSGSVTGVLCDKLPNSDNLFIERCTQGYDRIYFSIFLSRLKNGENSTEDDLNEFLRENPLTFLCVLKSPIERDLTPEEVAAYKALHTNYPTTIIVNDENAGMEVSYVADTQNYITEYTKPLQEQITALQNALVSLKISGGGYNGLTVDNSSNLPIRNLRLFGKSTQQQTTGAQLFNDAAAIRGKLINNEGNIINVKNAYLTDYIESINTDVVLSLRVDTIPSATHQMMVGIAIFDADKKYMRLESAFSVLGSMGVILKKNLSDANAKFIRVMASPGDATGVRIMFNSGNSEKPYEPYTGCKPSPSTDYIQEIEVPGRNGMLNVCLSDKEGLGEQRLTFEILNGLPGIPTTYESNYIDPDGVKWITDEVNLEKANHIQRVGLEKINKAKIREVPGNPNTYAFNIQNSYQLGDKPAFSNFAKYSPWAGGEGTFCVNVNEVRYKPFGTKTLEEVQAEFDKIPQIIICGQLQTPVKTELSPEVVETFEKLHTYYPATTVTTDEDVNLELEYIADTQKYVDTKIAEVSTAILQKGI